jgi:hypothetical protein
VRVFGRTKDSEPTSTSDAATTTADASARPDGGKGRPTPKRREAEQRHRRVVGAAANAVPAGATKAERKALRQAQRKAAALDRQKARQGLITGEESSLPPRDRGPARRWARNYVDARLNPGEIFLPAALLFLALGFIGGQFATWITAVSTLLFYGLFLFLLVDSILLRRRVGRLAEQKFGAEAARGTGTYAMTRALQFRMTRLPKPQVKRGADVS